MNKQTRHQFLMGVSDCIMIRFLKRGPFTNLNPLLHLEAVHVAVEDGGRGAVPDAGPQPHEEVDVVVVDAGRQLDKFRLWAIFWA